MEVGTGLAILGSAAGSKDLIVKVLGPTAEYIGGGIWDWSERRVNNVRTIFKKAAQKLGNRIEEPSSVHPKVLRIILDEGSFCDDELSKEYFAGVLASSRSSTSRDDRGAYFLNLVGKLSTYQIRTHYIFYTLFKQLHEKPLGNLSQGSVRRTMRIHIPMTTYSQAMDFSLREDEFEIGTHSLNGLMRELLIDKGWALGISENFADLGGTPDLEHGIIYATSITGIELYLWALGRGNISINSFFLIDEPWHFDETIEIKPGAKPLIHDKNRETEI